MHHYYSVVIIVMAISVKKQYFNVYFNKIVCSARYGITPVLLKYKVTDKDMKSEKALKLSKILEKHLIFHNNSMASLAKAIGINANTFRTYMNHVSFPEVENLQKIAKFLGISLDELNAMLESETDNNNCQEKSEQQFDLIKVIAQLEQVKDPKVIVKLIQGATNRLGELAS